MQYFRKLCILSSLSLAFSGFVNANDPCQEPSRWWVNFGLGAGTTLSNPIEGGGAGHYSFNGTLTPHTVLTFYRNGIVTGSNDFDDLDSFGEVDTVRDLGVMLGYVDRGPKGFWSLSTGIAYYEVEERYKYSYTSGPFVISGTDYRTKAHGVALPVQGQAFWTPFRHFGLGLIAHGIAVPDPHASLLLAIQIS